MIDFSSILNFGTIAITIVFSSMGVAIGGSLASLAAIQAMYIQPKAKTDIYKASVLGMALTETAGIIGLVITILLLMTRNIEVANKYYWALSNLGIAFAIGIIGFTVGLVSSYPVKYACMAIARQPLFGTKILNLMMLTLSFIQTPIIFAFIVSLLINYQAPYSNNIVDSLRHIGAGLSIGLGSIGPAIGLAIYSRAACKAIGINRNSYNKIMTFTFVSEALIETPVVFALVTALLLITTTSTTSIIAGIAMISAALCTGISNIVPGISSGKTAASACNQIAINPNIYSLVGSASLIAQGFIDSFTIYGWLISLLLIFFVK